MQENAATVRALAHRTRLPGAIYHDGRFATLAEGVDHYEQRFGLSLPGQQKNEQVEYSKSLWRARPDTSARTA